MFVGLLHRTTKYVIPRKGEALTWESPGTMFVFTSHFGGLYQEIATSRSALLAMTVVVGGWLRRFKQNTKLRFTRQFGVERRRAVRCGMQCVTHWPSAHADKLRFHCRSNEPGEPMAYRYLPASQARIVSGHCPIN